MKITVVEWLDPMDETDGWESVGDAIKKATATTVSTVGIVVHEDDKKIVLAFNLSADSGLSTRGTIPKSYIKRRRDFKYPWKMPEKG